MSIGNVSEYSQKEYENSVRVTSQLTEAIISQENTLTINNEEVNKVKREIASEREKFYEEKKKLLTEQLAPSSARQLELISERGVSCILTTLPLKDFGFILNKQQFHDYIALRYNYKISDVSGICGCNKVNSINHSLSCSKGGYSILRHNSLCKVLAELLEEAGCYDIVLEPILQDLTGETLPPGSQ